MRKYTTVPAITGQQLIKLLQKDGWKVGRRATHGMTLTKRVDDRTLVTYVDNTTAPLPKGTLSAILGPKQTRIGGKKGLLKLINKYGLD